MVKNKYLMKQNKNLKNYIIFMLRIYICLFLSVIILIDILFVGGPEIYKIYIHTYKMISYLLVIAIWIFSFYWFKPITKLVFGMILLLYFSSSHFLPIIKDKPNVDMCLDSGDVWRYGDILGDEESFCIDDKYIAETCTDLDGAWNYGSDIAEEGEDIWKKNTCKLAN